MNDRPCPLCGTVERSRLLAEARLDAARFDEFAYASRKTPEYMHPRLMLCQACDLAYASTPHDEAALHGAYAEAAFDSGREAALAARTYAGLLEPVVRQLRDRVGMVDIGAGDGALLREMLALGFENVAGVEPSRAPIESASPEIRGLIRQGVFERGMFAPRSCSLVTCFQTIEHVADPVALCAAAVELLKEGGALCLVAHNRRALSARLLGRRSPIYDIEHLQLFSTAALRRLLADAGLRNISARSFWNRYPLAYWVRLFPFAKPWKTRLLRGLERSRLASIPLALPAGNLVAWGFR